MNLLTNKYKTIDPRSIIVRRDERQRRVITTDDIDGSIRLRGVLLPLLVTPELVLIAGERRLTSAIKVGLSSVPVRFVAADISEADAQLLELEENLQRQDLTWQEKALAMHKIYNLLGGTVADFADRIGYTRTHVSTMISMAEEILKGNKAVVEATTIRRAGNIQARAEDRLLANVFADLVDVAPASEPEPLRARDVTDDIILADFFKWAPAYAGQKFNLIHCDFPYGIDIDDSDQMALTSVAQAKVYEDHSDLYWNLIKCLADNQQRLISSSAHIMFWFATEQYLPTIKMLDTVFPAFEFQRIPLIWHKTDNRGIASDVTRRPRHVYETALIGAAGDRKLIKVKSDAYGAPKANSDHVSEKPEPVLRHFLEMFTDTHTRLLDPTCGSGSALRAGESLGASSVLGLEIDPKYVDTARSKLREFRAKRMLSKEVTS